MATTINQGENFILTLTVLDGDSQPIPAADFSRFEIKAEQNNQLKKSWVWLPDDAGDEHITLSDGECQLEVESSVTKNWIGDITFEIVPATLDDDYFVSGAQTDVVCFDDLLTVEPCQ